MIWVNFIKQYLSEYSTKNIEAIENFYAENIKTVGSGVELEGRTYALNSDQLFFNSCNNLSIHITNSIYRHKTVFVELVLVADNKRYNEAWVFEIDDYGKIGNIRRYNSG